MELKADRSINKSHHHLQKGSVKWALQNSMKTEQNKMKTETFPSSAWATTTLKQFKRLSYFEQLEQVFLVEAGGRQAGTVYPVRHSVEQKSWVEPFLWYAVCPFWRIFLQPEQETRTAVPGTEGSILLMPEDATAGWKPDDSCGAKMKREREKTE